MVHLRRTSAIAKIHSHFIHGPTVYVFMCSWLSW